MIDTKTDRHIEPERLSAWIEGDLPTGEADEIARHLEGCAACQDIVGDLRAITTAALELYAPAQAWAAKPMQSPRAAQAVAAGANHDAPAPEAADGWSAIARRIERPRSPRRLRILAVAAAVALVLGALLIARLASPPSSTAKDPVLHRAHVELSRLQRQQQRTIDALMILVKRDRQGWDPTLKRTFTNNLGLVDAAIAECRRALDKRPGDVALKASLMAAYQRKVDLLELFTQSGEIR